MIDVVADMVATVLQVVDESERVVAGAEVAVLESMKMEIPIYAANSGTVSRVLVEPGSRVDVGDLLLCIEPTDEP